MTPKTWTEVLIERARLRGYLSGWEAATRSGLGESRIRAGRALYRISRLRPCMACGGCGKYRPTIGCDCDCATCHGSGIAPDKTTKEK
jgi:DnaJ-class molecular chaperone